MPSSFLEPYHPIVRAGVHAETVAAFSWLLQQHPSAAKSHVDRLDMDTVHAALTAAADFAMLLGARAKELRATPHEHHYNGAGRCRCEELPQRLAAECAYCGKTDCTDRWRCDREDRGHEVTIWKAAKR